MKKWIYDLSYDELKSGIVELDIKDFITDQVFLWIYKKTVQHIELWTNISKKNRKLLSKFYNIDLNKTIKVEKDKNGTKKFLIELFDKNRIESVLIKEKNHYTFCISTQVGCSLACKFCATGRMGLTRNLSSGEILSQILTMRKEIFDYNGRINIVFMGMGEPLLNYENLRKALIVITSKKCIKISPRSITISTVGILDQIKRFERDFPNMKISFSLNASNAKLRESLMPISKRENLGKILDYFRRKKRRHRITFEYVLIKEVNDTINDAKKIIKLLNGISCKINLIPFNENKYINFETPDEKRIEDFREHLCSKGFSVFIRQSKGKDINSACGQLAIQS